MAARYTHDACRCKHPIEETIRQEINAKDAVPSLPKLGLSGPITKIIPFLTGRDAGLLRSVFQPPLMPWPAQSTYVLSKLSFSRICEARPLDERNVLEKWELLTKQAKELATMVHSVATNHLDPEDTPGHVMVARGGKHRTIYALKFHSSQESDNVLSTRSCFLIGNG